MSFPATETLTRGNPTGKKINVYISLISSMVIGRLVWGIVMFCCMGFDVSKFGMSAFLAGAVVNALPGIVLQVILVPILVIKLEKYVNMSEDFTKDNAIDSSTIV